MVTLSVWDAWAITDHSISVGIFIACLFIYWIMSFVQFYIYWRAFPVQLNANNFNDPVFYFIFIFIYSDWIWNQYECLLLVWFRKPNISGLTSIANSQTTDQITQHQHQHQHHFIRLSACEKGSHINVQCNIFCLFRRLSMNQILIK